MGGGHARKLAANDIPRAVLGAVCDREPKHFEKFPGTEAFTDAAEMMGSGKIDAVVVATPHFAHVPLAIQGLEAGLHVLVEKPVTVQKSEGEKVREVYAKHSDQVFAVMYQLRTLPTYQKVKELITSGELGEIFRVNWTVTNSFRTQSYYASGDWRASWAGEGGGVLINQCPHFVDLFQWCFGMPCRVRAFCHFGKYHDLEVEDDVTAYLEYGNGMNAVFTASTGEAPGTNRLEIAADRGRVVVEGAEGSIEYLRNEIGAKEACLHRPKAPPHWRVRIDPPPLRGLAGHAGVIQNFADAILDGTPLVAPAMDGLHQVELAGAMLLSAFEDRTIELPMNAAEFDRAFDEKRKHSRYKKA